MSDIRSDYISIAGKVIDRAYNAYDHHGEFRHILGAMAKLEEEYNEVMVEFEKMNPNLSDMERHELWARIIDEAKDVATVAIRLIHFAEKQI